jgi:transglutaminase-like putative cysteine protease
MKFSITHDLRYSYDSPVRLSTQYLRLTPRDTVRQKVIDWKIETPAPAMRTSDGYGNILHVLTLDKAVSEIWVHAGGQVETSLALDEPSDFTGTPLSPLLFLRPTALTRVDADLAAIAEAFRRPEPALSGLRELADGVHERKRKASGDEITHAFIACCRHLGIPARYVSGYIHSPRAPSGKQMAINAWAEAWIEERWHSFDVRSNVPIGEAYVKVAMGSDYLDACPIRGVRTGGGAETLIAQAHVMTNPQ